MQILLLELLLCECPLHSCTSWRALRALPIGEATFAPDASDSFIQKKLACCH
jgi:hypothetical protein